MGTTTAHVVAPRAAADVLRAKARLAERAARQAEHDASERAKPTARAPVELAPLPIVARLPVPIATFHFDTGRPAAARGLARLADQEAA